MPAAKKPATRTSTSGRKRRSAAEPPALKRLNKSLDDAQKALVALRKDVGKDVSQGARDLHSDVGKFIKNARRDSGKLGTALRKDLEALQKRVAESGKPATGRRRTATRSTTANRPKSGRAAAKRG